MSCFCLFGLIDVLGTGLISGLRTGLYHGLIYGLSYGLGIGLSYWILLGLYQGITQEHLEEQDRRRFNQGLHHSLRNSMFLSVLCAGIVTGISVVSIWLSVGLSVGLTNGQIDQLSIGLNYGLSRGLDVAWPLFLCSGLVVWMVLGGLTILRHYTLRLLLAHSHTFPLQAQRFLDDATARVLLRRLGGGYSFVHRRLLDYFADAALLPAHRSNTTHPAPSVPQSVSDSVPGGAFPETPQEEERGR
jgi:hypothetical protein